MERGHADRLRYKWAGHQTGLAWLILTEQQGQHPFYQCKKCWEIKCFGDYLRVSDNGCDFDNLDMECTECWPSKPWRPDFNGKKLGKCRVHVVLPQGQKLHFYDARKGKLLLTEEFGIRRMKPDGNEFRLQPYLDRSNHEIRKPNPTGRLF